MSKHATTIASVPLLLLMLMTHGVQAQPASDRKAGEANLQEAGPFDDDKVQQVELSADGVTLTAKLYLDDFFDKQIISANAQIKNTADKPRFFHYYIAFFDADGKLLGCAAQGSFGDEGMAPDEDTQLGSCLVFLDKADLDKVRSYQAVLYVSDQPVGTAAE